MQWASWRMHTTPVAMAVSHAFAPTQQCACSSGALAFGNVSLVVSQGTDNVQDPSCSLAWALHFVSLSLVSYQEAVRLHTCNASFVVLKLCMLMDRNSLTCLSPPTISLPGTMQAGLCCAAEASATRTLDKVAAPGRDDLMCNDVLAVHMAIHARAQQAAPLSSAAILPPAQRDTHEQSMAAVAESSLAQEGMRPPVLASATGTMLHLMMQAAVLLRSGCTTAGNNVLCQSLQKALL